MIFKSEPPETKALKAYSRAIWDKNYRASDLWLIRQFVYVMLVVATIYWGFLWIVAIVLFAVDELLSWRKRRKFIKKYVTSHTITIGDNKT